MFQRILIVCVGNICRSPTAEILLRHYLPDATASSAGLHAMVGKPIDGLARAVLQTHGFSADAHVARQLEVAMLHDADLILAMEQAQVRAITQQAPQALGRTFLLGKWQREQEISDPYGQQRVVFEQTFQTIDAAVKAWLPYLEDAGQHRASDATSDHN